MSGIAPNPLNAISKVYLDQVAESAVPGKPAEKLKTDRAGYSIPKSEQESAAERIRKKTAEKKAALEKKHGMKMDDHPEYPKKKYVDEKLDPVGQEDGDVDNDGDKDKSDKYLLKRRKAISAAMKKRMNEAKNVHGEIEVPSNGVEKLAKKAVKRYDADNDGDVDKDDPKEKGMGEFVPSADGKKKLRTKIGESMSNWRQDLSEVMDDEIDSKKIKEKKVNNKIKINPEFKESIEQIGGTIIEMVEIGKIDEETEIEEGIGMTMANAVGNPPALSKRMKLKQALLNREIKKNAAANKKKSYSGKAAVSEAVKGQDTESRREAAAERRSGEKRLPPSKGKGYADQQKQSISYMDKLTKKNKNVVGLVTKEEFIDPEQGEAPSGRTPLQNVSDHPKASVRRKAIKGMRKQMGKEYGGKWKSKSNDPVKEDVEQIDEKALSKAQQRFMGMVHAVKKGEMKAPSPEVAKAAASMTGKEAKDFAKTKHKGLPEKKEVKEQQEEDPKEKQMLAKKKQMMQRQYMLDKQRLQMQQQGKLPTGHSEKY